MYALIWLLEFCTVSWHRSRGGDKGVATPYYLGQKVIIVALGWFAMFHHFVREGVNVGLLIPPMAMLLSYACLEWSWELFGNEKYHYGNRWDSWHIYGSGPSHYVIGGVYIYTLYGFSPLPWVYACVGSMIVWALRRPRHWISPVWMPEIVWEKIRKYLPDWST